MIPGKVTQSEAVESSSHRTDGEELPEGLSRAGNGRASSTHVSLVDRIAALPERPAAFSRPPEEAETAERPSPSRSMAWELPLLLVTALVMLAGLAVACYFSRG